MAEEKRVPQYRVIMQALEERIRSGAFSFDEPLCTEGSLMAEFGSSRITVRRALEELENKGFITRKRGIGCFVSRAAYESLRTGDAEPIAAQGQTAVYTLVFPQSWDKAVLQAAFDGASEILDENDAHAVLYLAGSHQEERPSSLLTRFAGMDIAGAAIVTDEPYVLLTEMNRLLLQGKAVVTLGGASALPHISSIRMDTTAAAEQMIGHLISLGHTRIAYFGGTDEYGAADYLLALHAHDLTPNGDLICRWGDAGALRRCIAAGTTAIVVQTEEILQQLARELTALGLHVPGNMSLCCMEDCAPLPALRKGEALRSVTCAHLDVKALGRALACRLLQLQGAPIVPARHDVLPVELHIGTTTAEPVGRR